MELTTMLEAVEGRPRVVAAVRNALEKLDPTGGLLALPEYPWKSIYTTNFDRLVEKAYRRAGKSLIVIRSNFDYAELDRAKGTPLLKIHGCISQDLVDGHRGRLVLTEDDYADYSRYRQVLFDRMATELASSDVLIIGQSLRDPHLQEQMREAAKRRREFGASGRLLAVVHNADEDRAALWEARGFTVASGEIDSLLVSMTQSQGVPETAAPRDPDDRLLLKPILRTAAVDVDHAVSLPADATRLFNGRAATYGDIAAGLTFDRSLRTQLQAKLRDPRVQFVSIVGVAGVGKTTLARQLLVQAASEGVYCWEHPYQLPFYPDEWTDVGRQLAEKDDHGVLLIDNCAPLLGQVNSLVSRLAKDQDARLKVVLTATATQWGARLKDPALFTRGHDSELSRLSREDIDNLVALASQKQSITRLVDPIFAGLTAAEQVQRLRERARADMYVCLKNIFANEQLDDILLQEFAELAPGQQDVYRLVAALEAVGGQVHRQLVLRLLRIDATQVALLLEGLEGIVDEYTVSEEEGQYGWATRHEVIAHTIARYKYSGQEELRDLLHRILDEINPTIHLELRALREMCNSSFGVESLPNDDDQLELFQKMVKIAPGERVPRHRVIRKLLEMGRLDAAAQAIRDAEASVYADRPISRYKVLLAIRRAETTPRILAEDRLAMLRNAETLALEAIKRHRDDRLSYQAYARVGEAVAKQSGDVSVLDAALRLMGAAYERILDPAMAKDLTRFERLKARFDRNRSAKDTSTAE